MPPATPRCFPGHYQSVLQTLGDARFLRGDRAGASVAFRRVLAVWPTHVKALTALAYILYMEHRDADTAEALLRAAAAADPNMCAVEVRINLAHLVWHIRGDLTEAESLYRAVVTISPDLPMANYNLAVFLSTALGRHTEAKPYLQKCLALNPAYPCARELMAIMLEVAPPVQVSTPCVFDYLCFWASSVLDPMSKF